MSDQGPDKGANTGARLEIRPTDFVAGGETAIAYEERLPSGDWQPYKPSDEWQRYFLGTILGYDTDSCVTFSALRIVEMQLEWMRETGRIPAETLDKMCALGWLDEADRFNFNEHFTACMSGTTPAGNTLQAVWDSIRRDGLLPQADGAAVNDFHTLAEWLDPSTITQDQKDKAKKSLELIATAYEWAVIAPGGAVWAQYQKHLKQAPIHIIVPVELGWNRKDGQPVAYDDASTSLGHAVSLIALSAEDVYRILDHYDPFIKQLAKNYFVPYGLKAIVTLAGTMPAPEPGKPTPPEANLSYGAADSADTRALQACLQAIKNPATGAPYMKPGVFGPFGPQTAAALAAYERAHGIPDYPAGNHYGPMNRAAMRRDLGL